MLLAVSKFTSCSSRRSLGRSNLSRWFSSDKSGKGGESNTPMNSTLKKLNIIGSMGIGSALLVSYLVIKKGLQNDAKNLEYLSDKTKNLSGQDLKPALVTSDEDEHLRILAPSKEEDTTYIQPYAKETADIIIIQKEKYNFIKKVVNECAGAVFYLELRNPDIKDPETGKPMIISNGSGFMISEDGWALTNAHVVLNKPKTTIRAIMKDGRTFDAKVEDADLNIDLALLKLDSDEKLPCLQFGKPGDASVGEWVVALGSPLSLSNSVTVGIVSSVNRPAEELGLRNLAMTYIQTDASITFGNSGGPLVNLDGQVIGINNMRLTSGISFAIPIEYVERFLQNSKFKTNNGKRIKIEKSLFGLTTIPITPDLLQDISKEHLEVPKDVTEGLLVWKVIPDTPAQRSGLEVGDIITHINGIPVTKPTELYDYSHARNELEIEVINKGKRKKVILCVDQVSLS